MLFSKRLYWLVLFVIVVIYLVFRLGWQNTIEFGYDQPRLAFRFQEFLANGSFLTAQNYSLETPWGNLSWGPFMVFFFSFILKISTNPLVASNIMAIFNLLSVFFVIYLGWKFFSPGAGLISGLILATQPWWVIFSRMYYQPSPIPSLVAISMLLTLLVLKNKKSAYVGYLCLIWTFMFQTYLMSMSIILTSLLFLLTKIKQISFKHLIIGILFSLLFFIPSIYYFASNADLLKYFVSAPGKFSTSSIDVIKNYFEVVSGSGFKWQLGNGYDDFLNKYKYAEYIFKTGIVFIAIVFVFNIIMFFKRNNKAERLLIMFWAIAPIWFISFVKVENVVPRYFLTALPAISLLIGIFINDLKDLCHFRMANFIYIAPVTISIMWLVLIVNYYTFIGSYNYPNGFLSNFSDIPYSYAAQASNWILKDSTNNNENSIHLTSDSWAVSYYFEYVNKINVRDPYATKYKVTFFSPDPQKKISARFGPITIYKGE